MPASSETDSSIARALTLEADASPYRGQIDATWAQGRTAFGGLTAALLLRASLMQEADRPVRSVLTTFVGPVAPGEVSVHVEVLRRGKSFTHTAARLEQGGQVCATQNVVFAAARSTAVEWAAPAAPQPYQPDAVRPLPFVEGMSPSFLRHFELRMHRGIPFVGSAQPALAGYVKHAANGIVDAPGILSLLDAWPPVVLTMLRAPAAASTVTWTVDFTNLPGPAHADSAFYYECDAVASSRGCATTEARLWASDGTLVCASRQLVAEFSTPPATPADPALSGPR